MAGWGHVSNSGGFHRSTLQEANLTVIPRIECTSTYNDFNSIRLSMVCAGGSGRGACEVIYISISQKPMQ